MTPTERAEYFKKLRASPEYRAVEKRRQTARREAFYRLREKYRDEYQSYYRQMLRELP